MKTPIEKFCLKPACGYQQHSLALLASKVNNYTIYWFSQRYRRSADRFWLTFRVGFA
jgi:hypothetical protein